MDFALKFWRPDIVILSNFFGVEKVKRISPSTFVILLEGEGFTINDSDRADHSYKNQFYLKMYDLIFLWGDAQLKGFKKYRNKVNIDNIYAIGNPKMDLIRYLPLEKVKKKKKNYRFSDTF